MNVSNTKLGTYLSALLVILSFVSCSHQNPQLVAAKEELAQVQMKQARYNYPPDSYEFFVSHNQYPVTIKIYKNPELLQRAPGHCKVIICLEQQRGRLYVDGQVAADWPVSTGIPGRETPTGNYTVRGKKESYSSNRYGKMFDAEGKCINSDADAFKDAVPEGGRFEGSPMPFWQRLTGDGIGMHIGKVRAGHRLSHGCIRTPGDMARDLYKVTRVGTRVSVIKDIEPEYPAREALVAGTEQNALERRARELQQKIYDLTMQQLAAEDSDT